jgi:CheY-like chemotaxis protein
MGGEGPQGIADEPPAGGLIGRPVLVVDGDAEIRAWVAEALERCGLETAVAADGREALRLVAAGLVRPRVLLTDIELPGMSGVELAARLLALRPGLRVVMMTGDPARAAVARDRTSIVATVLIKPIEADELLAAVGPDATAVNS